MHTAILAATCKIPLNALPNPAAVLAATHVRYKTMGADEAVLVEGGYCDDQYLYLPRQYGLALAQELGIPVDDQTAPGYGTGFAACNPPRAYQTESLERLLDAKEAYYDIVFRAHTGWGKTYGSLWLASKIGRTTLIVVDQDNLREQWEDALIEHFGFAREDIGRVQGPRFDYRGYEVVIATVHTLSQKTYPQEFYDYFGLVLLDEVHTIGSPTFSRVLLDFPAMLRIGVSATPKRKDVLQRLLEQHLGPVRVSADKEHAASAVYFVRNYNTYSWFANTSRKLGRMLTEVADDAQRNLQLAETIMWLRTTGRQVIVLSDRTEHMKNLADLCYYLGADPEEIGIYTGETPVLRWAKDPTPKRMPVGLWPGAEPVPYTPVSLQSISKKIPAATLRKVKDCAALLFGTYGKCAKGFDVPRMSGGADATPRSAAEQVHGRILRGGADRSPIWITMLDWNNPRLLGGFIARVQDYVKSNGEIYEWLNEGGLEQWQPYELIDHVSDQLRRIKSLRIEQLPDGRYMLQTQQQQMRSVLQQSSGTSSNTPRPRALPVASSQPRPAVRSSAITPAQPTSIASQSVKRLKRSGAR